MAQASFAAFFLGLPVLAPAFRAEYHLSITQTGVLIAAAPAGIVLTLYAWGIAADRVGERLVICSGLFLGSLAIAASAYTRSFGWLLVFFMVAAALGAGVNSGTGRAVMTWFRPNERGLALGIRQTAIPLAGVAAALTLPALAEAHGVRAPLLVLAGGWIVGATAALAIPGQKAPLEAGQPKPPALRYRMLWRLSTASVLVCVAQLALVGFVVLYLHDAHGVSIRAAAAVLAASQLLGAGLRLGAGLWSDRVGRRIEPMRLLALGVAATLATAMAVAHGPLVVLIPLLVLATGLSTGWNSLSFAAAAEIGGETRSGAAIGVQQTTLAIAGAGVPIIFAALVQVASWRAAFALAALFPVVGWWVLRSLTEPACASAAPTSTR